MDPIKIDIHTHILPESLPKFKDKFGYDGFMQIQSCTGTNTYNLVDDSGKIFRTIQKNCISPETRIAECDEFGVRVQVMSTLPVMFSYWTQPQHGLEISQFLNDHLAQIIQNHPKRFVGLGNIPLQDPELACKEAERCVRDLGLKGFQIGSHINNWNLSDSELKPFFKTCEALGASLFVHPWDMMGQDRMQKYWLPWLVGMPAETSLAICSLIFGGVFEQFPKLRVAFAHGGGSFPMTLGRIQQGFDCRPDLCAIDNKVAPEKYAGRFYVDSLVHDPNVLKFIIQLFGSERVCLGSDYPFPLGEEKPGQLIESMDLDSKTKTNLNYKSALSWLNLPETFVYT